MALGILACLGVWLIFAILGVGQISTDSKCTKWSIDNSKKLDLPTYHDYHSNTTRYTKTGQKCIKLPGFDINGELYHYVTVKSPVFGDKICEIKYSDPKKKDEEVKVKPSDLAAWKANGWID